MYLYLVQHAEAKREEEDPLRPLSEKGRGDIYKLAAYIAALDIKVDGIFHSAKLRAKQTSDVLLEHLKPGHGISESDGLNPLDDPELWANRLHNMSEIVMLVGHLPHLARLSALLLCGDKEKNIVDFKMGGIVCLKRHEDKTWSIDWILVPEVIV